MKTLVVASSNSKYEMLENDTIALADGTKLYRIRALRDISGAVRSGSLGGYIECAGNLAETDSAWVAGDAKVYGKAQVYGNAWVTNGAQVYGNARVFDDAEVHGYAQIRGNARVFGDAQVYGHAQVGARVQVYDFAQVHGNAWVAEGARVFDDAEIYGDTRVYGDAQIFGDAAIHGDACVSGHAVVRRRHDIVSFSGVGSEYGTLTVYATKKGEPLVTRGCFTGSVTEFLSAVTDKHRRTPIADEYRMLIKVACSRLGVPYPENLGESAPCR